MLGASVDSSHSARISEEAAVWRAAAWQAELLLAGTHRIRPSSLPHPEPDCVRRAAAEPNHAGERRMLSFKLKLQAKPPNSHKKINKE